MKKIANENFMREGSKNQNRLFNIQARKAAQEFLDSNAVVSLDDLDQLKQAYASSAGVDVLLQQINEQSECVQLESEDKLTDEHNIALILAKQQN